MSFAELVAAVAKDSGISERKVARVLRSFIKVTIDMVMKDINVVLPRFGVFLPKDVPAEPIFGGARHSKQRRKVRFRQSRTLR